VLLEGVRQAQNLLNTLVIDEYPTVVEERLAKIKIPISMDRSMQQSVLASQLFDAEQVKLYKKIKDPNRPAFTFPRLYGISSERKCNLTVTRFLNHCERFAGKDLANGRKIVNNSLFVTPWRKNGEHIQFELHANAFMVSNKPLAPAMLRHDDTDLPNIFPLKETISMPTTNIYDPKCFYRKYSRTKNTFGSVSNRFVYHFSDQTDYQFQSSTYSVRKLRP
jgi:large subunit ribosomal protein L37